jgi:hypothetical protein
MPDPNEFPEVSRRKTVLGLLGIPVLLLLFAGFGFLNSITFRAQKSLEQIERDLGADTRALDEIAVEMGQFPGRLAQEEPRQKFRQLEANAERLRDQLANVEAEMGWVIDSEKKEVYLVRIRRLDQTMYHERERLNEVKSGLPRQR